MKRKPWEVAEAGRSLITAAAFGRAMRAHRERLDITQEELALRIGCDRTYPSLMERGERCPSLHTVIRVAVALEIPASELVTGIESELKKEVARRREVA